MELLNLLLSDWVGRLSLFTVLFCVAMITYVAVYAIRQVLKSEDEATREDRLDDNTIFKV